MTRPVMDNNSKELFHMGYIHIAFSVGSIENVNMLTQKLEEDGYSIISYPRTTGDGYYESCVFSELSDSNSCINVGVKQESTHFRARCSQAQWLSPCLVWHGPVKTKSRTQGFTGR